MSYAIMYRAMFIRMTNGTFIPMIEAGDNNVYESLSPRRRARDWEALRWVFEDSEQKKRYSLTREEILRDAEHEIESLIQQHVGVSEMYCKPVTEEDVRKNFFYFSSIRVVGQSMTSASQFLNFIKSGFRHVIDFKDLQGAITLSWYEGEKHYEEYASTEDELNEKWAKCKTKGITPWLKLSDCVADDMWNEMKIQARKSCKEKKTSGEHFIVAIRYQGVQYYVGRITAKKLFYGLSENTAFKYSSRKSAEKAAKHVSSKVKWATDTSVVQVQ